jgi:hypothetical protein
MAAKSSPSRYAVTPLLHGIGKYGLESGEIAVDVVEIAAG